MPKLFCSIASQYIWAYQVISGALCPTAAARTGRSRPAVPPSALNFTLPSSLEVPLPLFSLDPLFFVSYNSSWLIPSFWRNIFSSSFPRKGVWEKSLRPCLKMSLFYSCNWSVVWRSLEFLTRYHISSEFWSHCTFQVSRVADAILTFAVLHLIDFSSLRAFFIFISSVLK